MIGLVVAAVLGFAAGLLVAKCLSIRRTTLCSVGFHRWVASTDDNEWYCLHCAATYRAGYGYPLRKW